MGCVVFVMVVLSCYKLSETSWEYRVQLCQGRSHRGVGISLIFVSGNP
jgi:hypothetical protein